MTEPQDPPSTSADEIVVDEPPLPPRTRRPADVLSLLIVSGVLTGLVAMSIIAERTMTSITADLADLNTRVPGSVVGIVDFTANLAGVVIPIVLVAVLMIRGRVRTTVELLLAGVAASVTAALVSEWLTGPAPQRLQDSLVPVVDGVEGTPVPAYPALLVAVVTVVSQLDVKRLRQVALFAIAGTFAVQLLQGDATVGGLLIATSIGIAAGLLVRIVGGQPSLAPSGQKIAATLEEAGYELKALRADPSGEYRRLTAETPDARYSVLVLDRNHEGAGTIARAVDRLRTREEVLPRQTLTLRDAIDRIALQSFAVARAGARTPGLRTVLRIDGDSAALVYDYVHGTALSDLSGEQVTDAMLTDLWRQLGDLRRNHVAHRRLSGRTIMVDDDGRVWLLSPSGGELAASDVAMRTDLAQALTATSIVAGPDRVVDTALEVLGPDVVRAAIPLLQPIALTPGTRQQVKGHREVLIRLRDRLVDRLGAPAEPLRLQRIRPLSLLTGVGTVVAVYLVGTQLSDVSFTELWDRTDWRWLILAVGLMFANYVTMALGLLGFVPERVPFWRVVGAQVAIGFLRLMAPTTVGNVAMNIRLLTKSGVAAPLAAASVAANQVAQVAVTFPLLAVMAVISGYNALPGLPSSSTLIVVLGLLLAAAVVAIIPPVRARLRELWSDFAERGLPRLLDVLTDPRKLAMAVGGILGQTVSLILCFYACLLAVGETVNLAGLAVVQLVGNTLGTAVPTPGGLGAVEAALTAGVSTLGVPASAAVTAVLVFRIVSFWLPILPGWVLWTQMRRRDLL
ncbi:flippase-like domain-containing protein [Jiangella rhizosphaerae]|uniref:TIGR00374 family protein n=1 Tax=Jiangella rhizosphaerae TaxID=2293569 RepID=A0A418KND9_9ACTN|nr:flippase-like domain-containing protein [Jiangella rhizosphaerae]RIQ20509.1 TIGR00374 family protein [Jiangella rhizosphaerae]